MNEDVDVTPESKKGLSYRDAGVDIEAGDSLVERIKPLARRTLRPGVLAGIGGFGALFEVPKHYREPVLVSGTDGVGTKLKLAFELDAHDGVGTDLVAMSVNDILVQGAEPLFFLDYFACGKLDLDVATRVIAGIARGCEQSGCALVGGETAEMPGMYPEGEYDLAGFAVGVVEKADAIDGSKVTAGDLILGLASSGAHSNGYSLIRAILARVAPSQWPPIDSLMAPTRIYVKSLLPLLRSEDETERRAIKAMAHITGGGLTGNIPRVLPDDLAAEISVASWQRPDLFAWLKTHGGVAEAEMRKVFNCGIGMVVVVAKDAAAALVQKLQTSGEHVTIIGQIIKRPEADQAVVYLD